MKRLVALIPALLAGCAVDPRAEIGQPISVAGQFFSQNDPTWAGRHLGDCGGTTIGSAGSALTAAAMAGSAHGLTLDPGELETFLVTHDGFANGCALDWRKVADFDGPGGFAYLGPGALDSLASLKRHLDAGHHVVVKSKRFRDRDHWVFVTGYTETGTSWHHFPYWDPWDTTAVPRTMSDGHVPIGAPTHVFE